MTSGKERKHYSLMREMKYRLGQIGCLYWKITSVENTANLAFQEGFARDVRENALNTHIIRDGWQPYKPGNLFLYIRGANKWFQCTLIIWQMTNTNRTGWKAQCGCRSLLPWKGRSAVAERAINDCQRVCYGIVWFRN